MSNDTIKSELERHALYEFSRLFECHFGAARAMLGREEQVAYAIGLAITSVMSIGATMTTGIEKAADREPALEAFLTAVFETCRNLSPGALAQVEAKCAEASR
jgi:hypothetical protein